MELHEAIRRRAMVRSFRPDPLDPALVDHLVDAALRSPTAGNTAGTAWVVLEGAAQTALYFDATTDEHWRSAHPEWSEGLRRAPVVLLAYTSPDAYVARYGESDKEASGLGAGPEAWPVPYWYGDAAMGVMAILLGRGRCRPRRLHPRGVPGQPRRWRSGSRFPTPWRLYCAVALGRPGAADHRSASLDRPRPPRAERLHRGRW